MRKFCKIFLEGKPEAVKAKGLPESFVNKNLGILFEIFQNSAVSTHLVLPTMCLIKNIFLTVSEKVVKNFINKHNFYREGFP